MVSRSLTPIPPLELHNLSPPGGIVDPECPYTDLAAIDAGYDNSSCALGLFPEVIITTSFNGPPGLSDSARSTKHLLDAPEISPRPSSARASHRTPASRSPAYHVANPSTIVAVTPYKGGRKHNKGRSQSADDVLADEKQEPGVWYTPHSTTVVMTQPTSPRPEDICHRPGPIESVQTKEPSATACFNCKKVVITYIYHVAGPCTWLSCILLAATGCAFGCCLIPFWSNGFKDKVHKCPNCHVVLGKHKML